MLLPLGQLAWPTKTDLIANMQGKKQHQHACGGIAAMMLCPPVMDVFEECWIVDLNLKTRNQRSSQEGAFCSASPTSALWVKPQQRFTGHN